MDFLHIEMDDGQPDDRRPDRGPDDDQPPPKRGRSAPPVMDYDPAALMFLAVTAAAHTAGEEIDPSIAFRKRQAEDRKDRRDRDPMMAYDAITFRRRGRQNHGARRSAKATLASRRDEHGYVGLCAEAEGGMPRLVAFRSYDGRWVLASIEERRRRPTDRLRLYLNGQVEYPDLASLVEEFDRLAVQVGYKVVLREAEALDYVETYVVLPPPPGENRYNPGCFWVAESEELREVVDQIWFASEPNNVFDLLKV